MDADPMKSPEQIKSGTGRQFQFVRCIGTGGFGEVYLAEMSTSSGFTKMVAVKLLKDSVENQPNVAQRMRDEARLLGMLRHRTIVRADDLILLSGRIAVIMEYVPGCNLTAAIDPLLNNGPFPHKVVLAVIQNVANALDVAFHRPSPVTGEPLEVLHRDIKPGNIRLTPDGEVKVLDFGIARSDQFDREAHTTEYQLGSLNYMAPELLTGGDASPASDVYSLGVTFFECLARERFGWAGEAVEMHTAKLDKRLAELVLGQSGEAAEEIRQLLMEMIAFEKGDRPQPAEVVQRCRDLEVQLAGEGMEDWAETTVTRLMDSEESADEGDGVLTGRTLFEEVSTASFHPQAIGMFHEEATLAVPGADAAPTRFDLRRRWPEFVILGVVLSASTYVYFSVDAISDGDKYARGRIMDARPPAAKAPAEVSKANEEAAAQEAAAQAAAAQEAAAQEAAREREKEKAEKEEEASGVLAAVGIGSMPMSLPVFVDGEPVGATPIDGLMLTLGKHKLVIKDGDKSIKKTIKVKAKAQNRWRYLRKEGKIR